MKIPVLLMLAFGAVSAHAAIAAERTIEMRVATASGPGEVIGTVRMVETPYGLAFYPSLTGLKPGLNGFHVHENPSCDAAERDGVMVAALGAGNHLDPEGTGRHGEPWGDGHLGDLPPLFIDAEGQAKQPVLAPRLRLSDVAGRSLMLHAGGDNHSDHPMPLGGGGARIACGVIAE